MKSLFTIKKKTSGRDNTGQISTRHRGGEHKRFIREVDFKRDKPDVPGIVVGIEYDPNRTARLALIQYKDGDKRYILSTEKMKVGDMVIRSEKAPIKDGNALPLKNIPFGIPVHAVEFIPGKGAQICKTAGSTATVQSVDGKIALVKMPSGEIRVFSSECIATIGQVGNASHFNIKLTKAGQSRHRGVRPTVRGVASHPGSHPHGGGEGRSSIGMHPKTPWGRPAMGKKTRKKNNRSNKLIISRRK